DHLRPTPGQLAPQVARGASDVENRPWRAAEAQLTLVRGVGVGAEGDVTHRGEDTQRSTPPIKRSDRHLTSRQRSLYLLLSSRALRGCGPDLVCRLLLEKKNTQEELQVGGSFIKMDISYLQIFKPKDPNSDQC